MIDLIVHIAILGLFVWAITSFVPMNAKFSQLIVTVGIIIAVFMVLSAFGLASGLPDYPIPRLR